MRPLAELIELLRADDPQAQLQAAEGILAHGTGARAAVVPLLHALDDADAPVRAAAARALGAIGADAQRAVLRLAAALASPELTAVAAEALGKIGAKARQAVPALEALLDSTDESIREAAATALHRLGAPADRTLAPLVDLLASATNPSVRSRAAITLGDQANPQALDPLTKACSDPAAEVRREVAHALGRLGPAAATAIPQLEALLQDPDELVRFQANLALPRIDPSR